MSALAKNRPSYSFGAPLPRSLQFPIADNVLIYEGALVMQVGGFCKPAAAGTAASSIVGVATQQYNNTQANHAIGSGQVVSYGADGSIVSPVNVAEGVFGFDSGTAGDVVDGTSTGQLCYAVDDHTVSLLNASNTRPLAGVVCGYDVATAQVLVGVYPISPANGVVASVGGVKRTAKYTYDFAVLGGSDAAGIPLTGPALPNNALVVNSFMKVVTALTGASATASVQLLGAGDIIADAAISGAPWSATNPDIGVCVYATKTTWLKTANATTIPQIVITTANLTAGKFNVFLEYVVVDG